jgi:hypothetical protein
LHEEHPLPEATIATTPYNGSLLGTQLLSAQRTLVLSAFGPGASGTLTDNDGLLGDSDDGVATYNGQPLNYIGSGTVQPGVNVLGVTVPLGASVPVVVFQAGGQTYFHYPSGPPNVLGAVALVVNISPAPYQVFTPVCFVKGTLIRTPQGDRRIEDLAAGDAVTDVDGHAHKVLWTGGRRMDLPIGLAPSFAKWLPVRIPAGAFGPGCPAHDLLVSQQHRLMLQGAGPELLFGQDRVLVPARALLGDRLRLQTSLRCVTYHHILCREHVVLLANGMPAESLLPAPLTEDSAGRNARAEAEALFPELAGQTPLAAPCAYPVLRARDAVVLRPGPMH